MSEWKEVLINDLCEVSSSKRIFYEEYVKSGIPFFRSKEIIELSNKKLVSTDLFITREKFNSINNKFGAPAKDDILLTSVGTLGIPYLVTGTFEFYFKDGNLTWFRKWKKEVNPLFFYWWLKSPQGYQALLDIAIGSTQQALTISGLKGISLLLPSLQEQKNIVDVISSLDDKINLLYRNNKTLEQLSETLFRNWLEGVENEGSAITMNIENVATVQNGYSFKSSEFVEEQADTIEVLKMGHISTEGGLRSSPKKDFVKRIEKYSKWILNKRDIILAMTDMKDNVVILGVPALIDEDDKYVLNQRVARIFLNEKSPLLSILILYMQMNEKNFISELQAKANSGVQVNLGTDTIRSSQVLVPTKERQEEILLTLVGIFDKLDSNRIQIKKLENMLNKLLPKLMNRNVIITE
jgi:type I restriction enzyme S subunit